MLLRFPSALLPRGADLKREEEAYWEETSSAQFRSVEIAFAKKYPACQPQFVATADSSSIHVVSFSPAHMIKR